MIGSQIASRSTALVVGTFCLNKQIPAVNMHRAIFTVIELLRFVKTLLRILLEKSSMIAMYQGIANNGYRP